MKIKCFVLLLVIFLSGCRSMTHGPNLRFFPGSDLAPLPGDIYVSMEVINGQTNFIWCSDAGRKGDEYVPLTAPAILNGLDPRPYWEYDFGVRTNSPVASEDESQH